MSDPQLRAVAAHGLTGTLLSWPDEPLPPLAWARLLNGVRVQRLSGLLVAAITDGALPATPEQSEQAQDLHFDSVCAALFIESGALQVVQWLSEADVPVRVLKGPAVAHLDYPDAGQRVFGDIDLLVPAARFDDAVLALSEQGLHRRHPQPRPGFDRRFTKGTSFRTEAGLEIDLHRSFAMGPYGLRLVLEDLWTRSEEFALAGQTLHALDPDVRFLHSCFHAALGDIEPRLVPQRDIVQQLLSGRVDVRRVRQLMARWQAEPVVARAVRLAWDTLALADVVELSEWARHHRGTRRDARDLRTYSDPASGYADRSIAALAALPSLQDKMAFAYALAFPQRTYVEGRYEGQGSRWRAGARALRRVGRRT